MPWMSCTSFPHPVEDSRHGPRGPKQRIADGHPSARRAFSKGRLIRVHRASIARPPPFGSVRASSSTPIEQGFLTVNVHNGSPKTGPYSLPSRLRGFDPRHPLAGRVSCTFLVPSSAALNRLDSPVGSGRVALHLRFSSRSLHAVRFGVGQTCPEDKAPPSILEK